MRNTRVKGEDRVAYSNFLDRLLDTIRHQDRRAGGKARALPVKLLNDLTIGVSGKRGYIGGIGGRNWSTTHIGNIECSVCGVCLS
jgi:hypothetical protein